MSKRVTWMDGHGTSNRTFWIVDTDVPIRLVADPQSLKRVIEELK